MVDVQSKHNYLYY